MRYNDRIERYPYIRDPTYKAWQMLRHRCNTSFGRVKWDPWWDDFETFKKQMGPRPPNCRLVRKDTSKGYDISNCFWGTRKDYSQQNRQKGTNYGKRKNTQSGNDVCK